MNADQALKIAEQALHGLGDNLYAVATALVEAYTAGYVKASEDHQMIIQSIREGDPNDN